MLKRIKQNLNSTVFIAAFVIIAVMISGVTIWSIRASNKNVDQAVDKLSSFYMEELVGKREAVLKDSLERYFNQLNLVLSMLEAKEINDQDSLRSVLADAQMLYGAQKLAVVDEDGIIYTSHSTFTDASRFTFLQNSLTEPRIVTSNLYGAKKQVVIAVPAENIRLINKTVVSCFMQIDIDAVAGSLAYEDQNDAGRVFIGLYYKNGDNLLNSCFGDIEKEQNLIDYIRTVELTDSQSLDSIEQSFRDGNSGLVTIQQAEDAEYIYYTPVQGTDWMLTVMVHDNTIADQLEYTRETMLRRNIFQLILTAVMIIAVLVIIGYLYKRNSDILRRQQELELKAKNEEQLRIARDEAEKANRAKTEFLFNMSHDIRTPMNAIIGFATIIEDELDKPDMVKNHLKKLRESSLYLLSIINNVLDMARIESGKSDLNIDVMDILDKNNSVLDMFTVDIQKKNLRLSCDLNIDHRYIYADLQKLQQIKVNLISNAVKYTPENGNISVRLEELACDSPENASYKLSVSDTGIGMSAEFCEHIFESFARERSTTENKIIGTGLGMAIVKKLVDMLDGTITVESEPGKGSCFTVITTHRIAEPPEDIIQQQASSKSDLERYQGKRILLAEDNELNAEIAMAILDGIGVMTEHAEDGVVCVDMLSKAEPGYYDLILMDVQMPNMNGYKATECIRSLPDKAKSDIPIIALTANAFEEDRKNALDAGMNGHLAKPIDVEKLTELLGEFL